LVILLDFKGLQATQVDFFFKVSGYARAQARRLTSIAAPIAVAVEIEAGRLAAARA